MTDSVTGNSELCVRAIRLMGEGTLEDFTEVIHPDAVNRESVSEPPDSRGKGPNAFYASALWLREAFSEMDWKLNDIVADGDLVVLHTTMSARHTGTFVVYDENGEPLQAFPSTGGHFAVTQTHWCRVADGMVIEHWANRDDLGQATQLGWAPPSPAYLVRMQLATRNARRQARR